MAVDYEGISVPVAVWARVAPQLKTGVAEPADGSMIAAATAAAASGASFALKIVYICPYPSLRRTGAI